MSLRSRVSGLFSRKTAPPAETSRPIAWIPSKRGGIVVTHDKALELSTCFACVRVISEDIAKLPWNVFAREGEIRKRLDGSAVSRILNTRPNPEMGSFTFRELLVSWALTWGNGYAEIERDVAGRPLALWPLSPDRVDPKRADDGRIIYEVSNSRDSKSIIEQRDMFHLHGMGFDGLCGYSMVGLAAQTLGFALAAEEHGSSFYGNNTVLGTTFQTDAILNDEGYNRLKAQLDERKGSKRAYEGMILEQGLKLASGTMTQVDAQFTETRRQQVEEICRWWRVPPHKVSELSRAHFSNVENLNIDYATDTLMPWIKRLEEEADWKLIGSRSQASYTRIAIQALMRGDSAARATFYKEMFNMGVFSQNKILELEDMDPIGPEGDEHYLQMNMTTLKNIISPPEPASTPTTDPVITNMIEGLFENDLKKAESAKNKYGRDAFIGWIAIHNRKSRGYREKAVNRLIPLLKNYGNPDVNLLLSEYAKAVRAELIDYYDGQTPDHGAICAVFFEALK